MPTSFAVVQCSYQAFSHLVQESFEDNYLSRPDPHLLLILGNHLLYISHQISSQVPLILDLFGCPSRIVFVTQLKKILLYSTIPFEILLGRFKILGRTWVCLSDIPPSASVLTNSFRSPYSPLQQGTRQGCPLSLLLFVLAIEPLAIALRSLRGHEGFYRGRVENRVSLYADDLLLYVTNPYESIPNIMSTLKKYGDDSGYKLNLTKSELLPINKTAQSLLYSHFQLKITNSVK